MALEFTSAAIGGMIGLLGGLGGVTLAHTLTSRREARTRRIEGLREVVRELEKRRRLALEMDQHINLGLRAQTAQQLCESIFTVPGWKEATLALQERSWLFSCVAYLPEAVAEFQELDAYIGVIMDPHLEEPGTSSAGRRGRAIEKFNDISSEIRSKAESKLRSLV